MFKRYRTTLLLLLCAVPAGFFPVATLGSIWDVVKSSASARRVRDPGSSGTAIGLIVAFGMISVISVFIFQRMLRRAGTAADGHTAYQLSGGAWKAMLWSAFATGVGFGIAMLVSVS
jgi:hypothetical protein